MWNRMWNWLYNWMWNCLSKLHSSECESKWEPPFQIVYRSEIGTDCVIGYQIEYKTTQKFVKLYIKDKEGPNV